MKINCLVLPNDPLIIYVKQGNLEQFIDRFKYYANNLGEVYILNVDKKVVNYKYSNVNIVNVFASNKLITTFKQFCFANKICKTKNIHFTRALEGSTSLKLLHKRIYFS